MLKLYFSPSSSSLATHIALIETGAAHELVPRLISKQETRAPEHLTLNPDGKVPVLVTESGYVLTEVAATLYYIARKYPASRLWPEGDLEDEAEVISWMSFAASTMHASRARGSEHVANAFVVANRKLGDRQWAVGRYLIADIHLFRVYWRFRPGIDAAPGTYPALEAHHDRMRCKKHSPSRRVTGNEAGSARPATMRRYSSGRLRTTLLRHRPQTKDAADAHRNPILRPVRL